MLHQKLLHTCRIVSPDTNRVMQCTLLGASCFVVVLVVVPQKQQNVESVLDQFCQNQPEFYFIRLEKETSGIAHHCLLFPSI